MKIAFVIILLLLIIWRVKKGFQSGMMSEVVNILSIIISCVCIVLVFFAVSSVMEKTFSTLTVCILGLIGIGILFKLCNLIFKPIKGITNLSIINGLDKILGAGMGLAEALLFAFCFYKILDYCGIYIF